MTSGLDHKTNLPNLTTEPPLDPPEPIGYKALALRRNQMQKYTPRFQWEKEIKEAEIAKMEAGEEEERLNRWRQQSEDDEREWAIAQEEKGL